MESNAEKRSLKALLLWCLAVQVTTTLIASITLMIVLGEYHFRSFAYGSVIFIVANTYFVFNAFRFQLNHRTGKRSDVGSGEDNHYRVMTAALSFKRGLFGKLVLIAVGFALAFRFIANMNAPLLFMGFITMIVLQVFLASRIAE